MIPAHSRRARGRMERSLEPGKDDCRRSCALRGIRTVEEANHFLRIMRARIPYSVETASRFSKPMTCSSVNGGC